MEAMRPVRCTREPSRMLSELAHQYYPDVVFFEVQYDGLNAGFKKLDQFAGLSVVEAINAGNTVAHLQNGAIFFQFAWHVLKPESCCFSIADISSGLTSTMTYVVLNIDRAFDKKLKIAVLHQRIKRLHVF
jgi:hypothetical protein